MPKIGYKHTPETLAKMSLAKKGKAPEHLVKYWTGRKQTAEHKAKSLKSLAINPHRFQKGQVAPMKGRKSSYRGSKHWAYKDGRTQNKEYVSWLKGLHERRKRIAEGSHTFGEWELLKKQYGFTCPMCGKKEPEIKLTQDHIIPVSKGGSDFIENIQPLCGSCNSKKHDKLIAKFQVTDNKVT